MAKSRRGAGAQGRGGEWLEDILRAIELALVALGLATVIEAVLGL